MRCKKCKYIKEVILKKVDINAENNENGTALTIASRNGNLEIIKELLKCVDIDIKFRNGKWCGKTALELAAINFHEECEKVLDEYEKNSN